MKYATYPRCACRGPDGKLLGSSCPDLWRADGTTWNHRHGSIELAMRIPTSAGTRRLRWSGYRSKAAGRGKGERIRELTGLAADERTRREIGDMIIREGRENLPSAEDVRRRLGLGRDPGDAGVTAAAWLDAWLAGKQRTRRASTTRMYESHIRTYIKPAIGDLPLERLNVGHVEQVLAAVGGSAGTRHRVLATLRAALNAAVRARQIPWNPCTAVELEPEGTPEARRWTAGQVHTFLAATSDDPLGLLYRIALLSGPRRAELCGLRRSGVSPDGGILAIEQTLLQLGGKLTEGTPKTRAGERRVYLGPETARLLQAHMETQELERQFAGGAQTDDDLVFCQGDGRPWNPDYVSKRFKRLAVQAGLPPIKLHEARHSAISLMRDAGVDREIRMREAGHADQAVADRYTHILDEAHRAAASQTEGYVLGDGGA